MSPRRSRDSELLLIDDAIVVRCSLRDARTCLDGPRAVVAWFDVHREGRMSTIRSPAGLLELQRDSEDWRPEDCFLRVTGSAGLVRFYAYFTARAVLRVDRRGRVREGTELWTHVELAPASKAARIAAVVRGELRQGLEHLRWELDAETRLEG